MHRHLMTTEIIQKLQKFLLDSCHQYIEICLRMIGQKITKVIKVDKISHDVYKAYLKYLYTNTIDLYLINTFEKVSELFDLANAYYEDNLKKQCIYRIKQEITVSNVAYFYNFAVKYETEELREFCVRFAVIHMRAVVKTENFAKLEDEKLMNRFINE
ncbi:PREDICTED: RCC1 and BTB domain-containing protein 1-like, partial [Acromyrmex echinatior]|uniref:RCC1 and BTB domain-containing protein 1-like n=1 Tax=Acromyrmex echinatior TaxID=103372 RepID=UPI000580F521